MFEALGSISTNTNKKEREREKGKQGRKGGRKEEVSQATVAHPCNPSY
jgi:hypothetical protein